MYIRSRLEVALRSATTALVILSLTGPAAGANTAAKRCVRANPAVTGLCYAVHGTAQMSADIGMTLGVPGQKTIVLWPPPGTDVYAPPEVEAPLDEGPPMVSVEGQFLVCPLPEEPNQFGRGFVRYGCISRASAVTVHRPIPVDKSARPTRGVSHPQGAYRTDAIPTPCSPVANRQSRSCDPHNL